MALNVIERLLENLPAAIIVAFMSFILIKFVWKSKQRKRNFDQLSIFVTSCDSALGFDVARRMDRLGFTVFAGFQYPDGEAALRLKARTSNRLKAVGIDVTDDDQVKKALDYVEKTLETPGLYCLINSASTTLSGHFQWYTASQCQKLMDVNVMGTIRATKYFLPLLKLHKGRIINLAGMSGKYDYPQLSVQSTSKSALIRFSNLIRQELEDNGVSVSLIEHEDGMPFTINLTEKGEINDMRLNLEKEHNEIYIEELYQWHRSQDAKAKRSLKAEVELLKHEVELIEKAVTSQTPQNNYSTVPCSKKILAHLSEFLPSVVKSPILKILYK